MPYLVLICLTYVQFSINSQIQDSPPVAKETGKKRKQGKQKTSKKSPKQKEKPRGKVCTNKFYFLVLPLQLLEPKLNEFQDFMKN